MKWWSGFQMPERSGLPSRVRGAGPLGVGFWFSTPPPCNRVGASGAWADANPLTPAATAIRTMCRIVLLFIVGLLQFHRFANVLVIRIVLDALVLFNAHIHRPPQHAAGDPGLGQRARILHRRRVRKGVIVVEMVALDDMQLVC